MTTVATIDDFSTPQTFADMCKVTPAGVLAGLASRELTNTNGTGTNTDITGGAWVATPTDAVSFRLERLAYGDVPYTTGCGGAVSLDLTPANAFVWTCTATTTAVTGQTFDMQVRSAGSANVTATFDPGMILPGTSGTIAFVDPLMPGVTGSIGTATFASPITWSDIEAVRCRVQTTAGTPDGMGIVLSSIVAADPHIKCLDGSRIELYDEGCFRMFDYTCAETGARLVVNADVEKTYMRHVHAVVIAEDGTQDVVVPTVAFENMGADETRDFECSVGDSTFTIHIDKRYNTLGLSAQFAPGVLAAGAAGVLSGQLAPIPLSGGVDDVSTTTQPTKFITNYQWRHSAVATHCDDPHFVTATGRSVRADGPTPFVLAESLQYPDAFSLRGTWTDKDGLGAVRLRLNSEDVDVSFDRDSEIRGTTPCGAQVMLRFFANGAVTIACDRTDTLWGVFVDTPADKAALPELSASVTPVRERVGNGEWLSVPSDAPQYVRQMEPHLAE